MRQVYGLIENGAEIRAKTLLRVVIDKAKAWEGGTSAGAHVDPALQTPPHSADKA